MQLLVLTSSMHIANQTCTTFLGSRCSCSEWKGPTLRSLNDSDVKAMIRGGFISPPAEPAPCQVMAVDTSSETDDEMPAIYSDDEVPSLIEESSGDEVEVASDDEVETHDDEVEIFGRVKHRSSDARAASRAWACLSS